ncbi:hypothetical protein EXN66_Car007199 [Channa argus]|uniref:Uncharacterized protein n=1 Tax=Channa argus TaxID=215402 RepID=A0A6G1PN00_CHAAH|nr:hypothetical protein EXN66_Car007199 [Channa argus]
MASKQLSKMAVQDRVTAALSTTPLQVPFSHSTRDEMVLSIQEKVGQGYAHDVLVAEFFCGPVQAGRLVQTVMADLAFATTAKNACGPLEVCWMP